MTYLDELDSLLKTTQADLSAVRLVVFDVDGVLTDGRLYYSEQGETLKVFHVRDGVGLKLLNDMDTTVAVITAKDSPMVKKRMSQLGIQHYFAGVKDKSLLLEKLTDQLHVGAENICYVGDDMVDVNPMSKSGVSICPADAFGLVREMASIVLPVNGGQGVARMVCDLILHAQGKLEQAYQMTTRPEFERVR